MSRKFKGRACEHSKNLISLPDGVVAEIDQLRKRFVEKFGREPEPNDPLFFDEDYHVPVPVSEEKVAAEMAKASLAAGIAKTEEEAKGFGIAFVQGRIRVKRA